MDVRTAEQHEEGEDWQLKYKLRIVSDRSFDWLDASRPLHEAKVFSSVNKTEVM